MDNQHNKQYTFSEVVDSLVTRKQLNGYGLSEYHSKILTQSLTRVGKWRNAYAYNIEDVCQSINQYLQKPRIKESTHVAMEQALISLLARVDNVIPVPFGCDSSNSGFKKIYKQLMEAISDTNKSLAKLHTITASIDGNINSKNF